MSNNREQIAKRITKKVKEDINSDRAYRCGREHRLRYHQLVTQLPYRQTQITQALQWMEAQTTLPLTVERVGDGVWRFEKNERPLEVANEIVTHIENRMAREGKTETELSYSKLSKLVGYHAMEINHAIGEGVTASTTEYDMVVEQTSDNKLRFKRQ